MPLDSALARRYTGIALAAVLALALVHLHNPLLTPDSWSYYELSRNIFSDFYRINTWRHFDPAIVGDFGVSFPPLYPVLLAVVDEFAGIGIYSGYALNFLIVAALFFVLARLGHSLSGRPHLGAFLFAVLLLSTPFLSELSGARTMPLALLLFCALYLAALAEWSLPWKAVVMASLCGLATLLRFDSLPFGLVVCAYFWWGERSPRHLMLYLAVYLAWLSPWVYYSWAHFDRIFVTDNGRTMWLAVANHVTDYFPERDRPPTLFDSPGVWFVELGRRVAETGRAFLLSAARLCLYALPALWLYGRLFGGFASPPTAKVRRVVRFFALASLTLLVGFFLTGYHDERYFLRTEMALLTAAALWWAGREGARSLPRRLWIVGALVLLGALFVFRVLLRPVYDAADYRVGPNTALVGADAFQGVLAELNLVPGARLLGDGPPFDFDIYRFGAQTGAPALIVPRNLGQANVDAFLTEFRPTHVLTRRKALLELLGNSRHMAPTHYPDLYRIEEHHESVGRR